MSGENGLSTGETPPVAERESIAVRRFNRVKRKLEEFSQDIGFPADGAGASQEIMEISGADFRKMTAEQCEEVVVDLANYALHVRRTLNRETAYSQWLASKINMAIADELNQYEGYYSQEQRRAKAIVNNAYAKELEELRINTEMKIAVLAELPFQINQLCRVASDVRNGKRQSHTNGHRYG